MRFLQCFAIGLALLSAPALAGAEPAWLEELLALMADGEYDVAEARSRELLSEFEATNGPDSIELTPVLDVLVEARWRGGKATEPETRALGERSLEIKRGILGPDDATVGKSLHHLAVIAYFRGEFDAARSQWEEAIRIRKAALGSDHADVAESMNGLALLLVTLGRCAEAPPAAE